MGSRSAFVIGFIVGVIVGWMLGILSAPQSGQEMREALGERAVELRERAEGVAARARREAMDAKPEVEDEIVG